MAVDREYGIFYNINNFMSIFIYKINRKMQPEYDFTFKFVMAGDASCGKTSIIMRYIYNKHSEYYPCTIDPEYRAKPIIVNGTKVQIQLWDTAGQERFRAINKYYYKGAKGICLVFDLTLAKSFENIDNWCGEIKNFGEISTPKILIGNKSDLAKSREVSFEEALDKAKLYGMKYIETSAKDGINIEQAFTALCIDAIDFTVCQKKKEENKKDNHTLPPTLTENIKKYC